MTVSKTGIGLLDDALMDGVPKGYTTLVYGLPGSGTDLLAKQFATAGPDKEETVFVTTTERDADIMSTMEYFGWKKDIRIINLAKEYYDKVLVKELDISKFRKEGIRLRDVRKPKEDKKLDANLLTTLIYEAARLKPPFRLVVHSLDFFFEYYDHSNVLSAIRTIKMHTELSESVTLLTLDTGVLESRVQIGIEEVVDCVLELERQRDGLDFKRNLVVRKLRNHPEKTGVYPIDIGKSGIGKG
jgi:KaiC/GvpD/RAD55 family RecA-like ATPase